ncbi:MAG: hypothetical protein ABI702_06100 [Burkholderiales bacterium]
MKFFNPFPLNPAALIAAFLISSAQAALPLVDSTGVARSVVATQVLPASLSQSDVTNIVNNTNSTNSVTSNGIPAGYTQIVVPMGPRYLGNADSGLAAAGYYYGLNYPTAVLNGGQASSGFGAGGISAACGTNPTSRVVVIGYQGVESESGTASPPASDYYVCEPQGTRSTLQKTVGAVQLALGFNDINVYKVAGSIGVSTNATTAICQARGYVNYVQGSGTTDGPGFNCGDQITRWNGSSLYSDNACYNSRLLSVTCWK